MTGYAIFNIEIKKPEEYKEYVEKVKPIAEMYGGEYIVRAVSYTHLTLPTKPKV